MNYDETLDYIHRVSWTGSRPGLSRITELLGLLGNPQDRLRFIHVAGTNGKGSFCAMCDSVLRAAGYDNTGLYTSPYLERFNERIVIGGSPVSDGELAEISTYVRGFADTLDDPPTEFELITAVAMVCFERHRCNPVVLEVGMGGRLDATNIIKTPVVSVITGISLDHTAVLGDTVEKIAAEKAGIIKPKVPVVWGGRDETAKNVIAGAAERNGSEFFPVDSNGIKILSCNLEGTTFAYAGRPGLHINLLGLYQPCNAATVVTAVDVLNRYGFDIPECSLWSGLERAQWKGRFEPLDRRIPFIIDGSHNPEGIASAIESIKHYFGGNRVCILTGVLKDKDYAQMAREISAVAARAFTLTPNNPRALDARLFSEQFSLCGVPSEPSETIPGAVGKAVTAAINEDLPLVALGSLYMYGDVKAAFEVIER